MAWEWTTRKGLLLAGIGLLVLLANLGSGQAFETDEPVNANQFPDIDLTFTFESGFGSAYEAAVKDVDDNWAEYGADAGGQGTLAIAWVPVDGTHEMKWEPLGVGGAIASVPGGGCALHGRRLRDPVQ